MLWYNQPGYFTVNFTQNFIPTFLSIGSTTSFINLRILSSLNVVNSFISINSGSNLIISSTITTPNMYINGSGTIIIEPSGNLDLFLINQTELSCGIISNGIFTLKNNLFTFMNPVFIYGQSFTHSGTINFQSTFEFSNSGALTLNNVVISGNFTSSTTNLYNNIQTFNSSGSLVSLSGYYQFGSLSINQGTLVMNNGSLNLQGNVIISSLIIEDSSTLTLSSSGVLNIDTIIINNSSMLITNGVIYISTKSMNIQTNFIGTFNQNTYIVGNNLNIQTLMLYLLYHFKLLIL